MTTIKVLGTGCAKCKKQTEEATKAAQAVGGDITVEKVEDIEGMMAYGVMMTPAVVIDEQVVGSGKVMRADKIEALLRQGK